MMGKTYRWSESKYYVFMRICLSIGNLRVYSHPLRDKDGVLLKIALETVQIRR